MECIGIIYQKTSITHSRESFEFLKAGGLWILALLIKDYIKINGFYMPFFEKILKLIDLLEENDFFKGKTLTILVLNSEILELLKFNEKLMVFKKILSNFELIYTQTIGLFPVLLKHFHSYSENVDKEDELIEIIITMLEKIALNKFSTDDLDWLKFYLVTIKQIFFPKLLNLTIFCLDNQNQSNFFSYIYF